MPVSEKFLKPYQPKDTENSIYQLWEESGFFNPDVCIEKGVTDKDAEPFSIVLPPPNVTGILHMGSALMLVVEDILVRFARMRGNKTLWIPGTDSAAIATQAKVEKEIQKKEKKNRHDLGREELLARIDAFVENNKTTILEQIRKMGASVDWSRYAYTMDEPRYHAVMHAFIEMHRAGLIYRGNRVVNWDPKGQTVISDDEIVYEERKATLYTFRYWEDFPVPIATTRPETKVGDTAVAVHPDDARYQKYIGQEYTGIFANKELTIRVVGDVNVDKDFGTGALGVTPAHSNTDWEIAEKNNLPHIQVINEYARMTDASGTLVAGLKTTEAQEKIAEWLRQNKLMEKEERITQNVSTAERTGGIIEPLPKLQWFVAVNKPFERNGATTTLKDIMRDAVTSGAITILPKRFEKNYCNWVDNLHDWCISRQIWFGHRIPVWYHEPKCMPIPGREDEVSQCIEMIVSETEPTCEHCQAKYTQDPDVLDTWFSSSLWTFSTLGWPKETKDLKTYHPTTLLETGYDILPLWVSRMILMSGFHLGDVPFRAVYLHGIVRDEKNRKLSKSLGNNIDPIDMGNAYGTDAVRTSLIFGTAPGADSKISEHKIKAQKHFVNKLWNIARFVLEYANIHNISEKPSAVFPADTTILTSLDQHVADVSKDFEKYNLHLAIEKIYHYIWRTVADTIIEESKPIFSGSDEDAKRSRAWTLYTILTTNLKLLHPFIPFVTEEIWQEIPHKDSDMLMVAPWPQTLC